MPPTEAFQDIGTYIQILTFAWGLLKEVTSILIFLPIETAAAISFGRATTTGWAFPPRTFGLFKSTSARSVSLLLASPVFCLTAQNFGGPQLTTFQTDF